MSWKEKAEIENEKWTQNYFKLKWEHKNFVATLPKEEDPEKENEKLEKEIVELKKEMANKIEKIRKNVATIIGTSVLHVQWMDYVFSPNPRFAPAESNLLLRVQTFEGMPPEAAPPPPRPRPPCRPPPAPFWPAARRIPPPRPRRPLGVRAARRDATWRSQRRGRGPRSPAQLAAAVAAARWAEGGGARAGAEGAERGSGGQCLWVTAGAAGAA
jgi:hypothetical protein